MCVCAVWVTHSLTNTCPFHTWDRLWCSPPAHIMGCSKCFIWTPPPFPVFCFPSHQGEDQCVPVNRVEEIEVCVYQPELHKPLEKVLKTFPSPVGMFFFLSPPPPFLPFFQLYFKHIAKRFSGVPSKCYFASKTLYYYYYHHLWALWLTPWSGLGYFKCSPKHYWPQNLPEYCENIFQMSSSAVTRVVFDLYPIRR